MENRIAELLKKKCNAASFEKLSQLDNPKLHAFVAQYIELLQPDTVYVCNDSKEDRDYIRRTSITNGEEKKLSIEGHTIHFDGMKDQGRDKEVTKYLLPNGVTLGPGINSMEKGAGITEVHELLRGSMKGREMYVMFFCLGPVNSPFALSCVQITDSCYVGHSEYMLYRTGYEQFKKLGSSPAFFRYVHSAGEMGQNVSAHPDKKRIYINLEDEIVYSVNTQYAGNTVGLKKLSLRLAIQKAARDKNWLAEHMFLMGVHGPKKRKTYFMGAFPSACGKTSTAMLPGETILGDDIAYIRKDTGVMKAVNVESGIFGIIGDVNQKDDPVIWDVLTKQGEVIFSNVLVDETNNPRWLGDKRPAPTKGINFSGSWTPGKKDETGADIPYAHKNARYTVSLRDLKNVDSELDNPQGVMVEGIIYGGRDSSVLPPVQEAFGWEHGIVTMGAALESETTAAVIGKEGVRQINPMSNIDFLSITMGKYVAINLDFAQGLKQTPKIFGVNYFQKDAQGKYLTGMEDKRVWVKWMELRVHGEVEAIKTPTGFIPKYKDLQRLFKEVLNKEYTEEAYVTQFSMRVQANIDKMGRVIDFYHAAKQDVPQVLFAILEEQKARLTAAKGKGDIVPPSAFEQCSCCSC